MTKSILGYLVGVILIVVAGLAIHANTASPFPESVALESLPPSQVVVQSHSKAKSPEKLILSQGNFAVLRMPVTAESADQIAVQLSALSQNNPDKPLYFVLDTPGGSVHAGLALIDTLSALPNPIHTVTLFSASMGFHIVQRLKGRRLITPSGTLMSHRIHVEGMGGDVPGNAVTRLHHLLRGSDREDSYVAARMNMSLRDYKEKIRDEYWIAGDDAVADGAADATVLPICDSSLNGNHGEIVQTSFGAIEVTFADCPLIRSPLGIKAFKGSTTTPNDDLNSFVRQLFYDKASFVKKYILNGSYTTILNQEHK